MLNLQYNATGNRTSMATQAGGVWNFSNVYQYDSLNRLSIVTQSVAGGIVDKQVQLTYGLLGNVTGIDRFSDAGGTVAVAHSGDLYDTLNRLTTLTQIAGSSSTLGV